MSKGGNIDSVDQGNKKHIIFGTDGCQMSCQITWVRETTWIDKQEEFNGTVQITQVFVETKLQVRQSSQHQQLSFLVFSYQSKSFFSFLLLYLPLVPPSSPRAPGQRAGHQAWERSRCLPGSLLSSFDSECFAAGGKGFHLWMHSLHATNRATSPFKT